MNMFISGSCRLPITTPRLAIPTNHASVSVRNFHTMGRSRFWYGLMTPSCASTGLPGDSSSFRAVRSRCVGTRQVSARWSKRMSRSLSALVYSSRINAASRLPSFSAPVIALEYVVLTLFTCRTAPPESEKNGETDAAVPS